MADQNHSSNSSDNGDHHNQGGMNTFILAMVIVVGFFTYVTYIHPRIDLGENIQDVPVASANAPTQAAVDVSKIAEPWVPNDDMVANGKKLFAANCSMCHGNEGKGDGPAGMALNPRPRNLQEGPWKKGGGFIGWYTVLSEGLPPSSMASFAHLKPVDRWSLVQFINSITKAKVTEDPKKVAEFAKTAK